MRRLATGLFGRFKPSSNTGERRAFIQGRIALYCKLMFWSFAALVGFINVMYALYPHTRPAESGTVNILASVGVAMLLGAWLAASRRRD